MGVVYKAHDTELDRDVALKFLPHGPTADESEQARFLLEAGAASALNHPNICAIHTLGGHEGERFIDMEFVDGKNLREIVPVKKMQDAIANGIQIAEALQEAYTHGIVHSNIKAENIMVNSKNQVKVMDFGLAKLKGSLKLTKTSRTHPVARLDAMPKLPRFMSLQINPTALASRVRRGPHRAWLLWHGHVRVPNIT
jgi:serine/threonine protein kinase